MKSLTNVYITQLLRHKSYCQPLMAIGIDRRDGQTLVQVWPLEPCKLGGLQVAGDIDWNTAKSYLVEDLVEFEDTK